MQYEIVLKKLNFNLLTPRVKGFADKIFATMLLHFVIIPAFFFRKKGILISYQSWSVVRLFVRLCVRASVRQIS